MPGRRLLIRGGVEPARMHEHVSTTLQEAKPKAGSRPAENDNHGRGPQTGVKPRSRTLVSRRSGASLFRFHCDPDRTNLINPTKINRGGSGRERHVGPAAQKCGATRCGNKTAKG